MTMHLSDKESLWRSPMRLLESPRWIAFLSLLCVSVLTLLLHNTLSVSAQVGTPPSSSISTTSGPVSWDFGPVVAGTFTNVGIQDTCPPGICAACVGGHFLQDQYGAADHQVHLDQHGADRSGYLRHQP